MIIGLTGKRGVGKSEVARILSERGFERMHTFGGGKAATFAYFRHLGADDETAREMVDGRLKDLPSPLLPGCATPRSFMERLGKFFGVGLGAEWTLGAEIDRVERLHPGRSMVAESVVYEADLLKQRGGTIIRVLRPDHDGPVGMHTDSAQAEIETDHVIVNDGSLADLAANVDRFLEMIG